MDTFDLNVDQAIVEAVKEFQLRGVELDGINTRSLVKQDSTMVP
jgi:hypothetical protein